MCDVVDVGIPFYLSIHVMDEYSFEVDAVLIDLITKAVVRDDIKKTIPTIDECDVP